MVERTASLSMQRVSFELRETRRRTYSPHSTNRTTSRTAKPSVGVDLVEASIAAR